MVDGLDRLNNFLNTCPGRSMPGPSCGLTLVQSRPVSSLHIVAVQGITHLPLAPTLWPHIERTTLNSALSLR